MPTEPTNSAAAATRHDSERRAAARAIRELRPFRESRAIRRAIHSIIWETRQASYGR